MSSETQRPWLVIGASGFVGKALGQLLDEAGTIWIGTCYSTPPGARFQALDLLDPGAIEQTIERVRPSVVIHLGGHPPGADEAAMTDAYAGGTRNLRDAIERRMPDTRWVVVSSAAIYGNAPVQRSHESDPPRPLTAYGRAKAAQEAVLGPDVATGTTIARLFNPIGPGQGPNLLAGALLARLREGERPLRLHAADHLRDFLDVRDAARALLHIGATESAPAIVNVCRGDAIPVAEIGRRLCVLSHGRLEPIDAGRGEDALWRSVGDPGRLEALGWRPVVSLGDSLRDQWRAAGAPCQNAASAEAS